MIKDKLDKIIELLEKLVPKPININSPISVKSEEGKGVDINKHLYDIANKVYRRQTPIDAMSKEYADRLVEKIKTDSEKVKEPGKEKFIARANKIDWNSLKVEKPTIRLLDDKGNVINFECQIKDDGSITCANKDAVVVDWSLKKDDKNKKFSDGQPRVLADDEVFIKSFNKMMERRKAEPQKIAKEALTPDGKQFWVFKKKGDKFVKVGTAEIVGEPPIVRITFLTDYKKEYIENPSSYEYGFWTMTDYRGSSYLGYQKNLLESYQFKYNFTELTSPEGVTGYLTDEGRAVYYDQYL